MIYFHL
jgi:flagellar basal body-associated protein FliL